MVSSAIISATHGKFVQFVLDDNTPSSARVDPAITNTLSVLLGRKDKADWGLDARSTPFAITPSHPLEASAIGHSTAIFLRQLARSAHAAAGSVYCGSVLAGHASETDEYGDVALFLGPAGEPPIDRFGPGHERDVLDALGLGHLLQEGHLPEQLNLSPTTCLPRMLSVPSEPSEELRQLIDELRKLKGIHAFRITGTGNLTIYFLVGCSDTVGWVGLAGVGVET